MTAFTRWATLARGIIAGVAMISITFALSVVVILASSIGWKSGADAVILLWGRSVLALFGVRVNLTGMENFPPGKGFLVLFNHQSLFDIPILYGTFKRRMRFGAKIELFKIPFFGPAMRSVGTLPIARNDRSGTLQIYRKAESMFAEGFSFALAPEGTRQDEPRIGKFKAGPFLFAIGAQASIVPAVIRGAHEVLPKRRLIPNVGQWRRTVDLVILPSIPTVGLGVADVGSLSDRVRSAMIDAFSVNGVPAESRPPN